MTRIGDRTSAWLTSSPRQRIAAALAATAAVIGLAAVVARTVISRSARRRQPPRPPAAPPAPGLSRAEAEQRLAALPAPLPPKEQLKILLKDFFRRNFVTIFNINMALLALLYFLLGNYLGTIINIFLLCFASFLKALTGVQAVRNRQLLEQVTAPRATVIRDGLPFAVPFRHVFAGDVIAIGPGDQVPARSRLVSTHRLVVDTSGAVDEDQRVSPAVGDTIPSGSYCLSGRGHIEAESDGVSGAADLDTMMAGLSRHHMTPFQRTMSRVYLSLFGLVLVLITILLVTARQWGVNTESPEFWNASAIVFSVAPSGIFFIVVMGYIGGMLRMSRLGGLVVRSELLEDVATCDVLCLGTTPALNGIQVTLKPIIGSQAAAFPVQRLNAILGSLARSISLRGSVINVLSDNFQGSARKPVDEAPYFSVYGWIGASFDDDDLRGVYVVGPAEVLQAHFPGGDLPAGTDVTPVVPPDPLLTLAGKVAGPFQRAAARLRRTVKRQPPPPPPAPAEPAPSQPRPSLVLAFNPSVTQLHDVDGHALLPERLDPLADLELAAEVRSGAMDTLKAVEQIGVTVRFLRDLPVDAAASEGDALAVLDERVAGSRERRQAVVDLMVQGHDVIVVGDSLNDVPAMAEATVSIATPSSTQAALGVAGIVLLRRSLNDVTAVLAQGQSSMRAVIESLELFLPQVMRVLILIFVTWMTGPPFPYLAAHGGAMATFNQALPFVILPFTSAAGLISKESLWRQLMRFCLPPGILQAILALAIFDYFHNATGDVSYAQVTTTYSLLFSGLLLLVFIRPIIPLFAGGARVVTDRSATYLAIGTFIFIIIAWDWRLASLIYQMTPPHSANDVAVILAGVLIWGIALQVIWRIETLLERWAAHLLARRAASKPQPPLAEAQTPSAQ